ncbi:hypothetical protein HDU98_001764, partial [Podochytrium sp. JEL0797]
MFSALRFAIAVPTLLAGVVIARVISAKRRASALQKMNLSLLIHPVLIGPSSILNYLNLIPSWIKIKFPKNWAFERKFSSFAGLQSSTMAICEPDKSMVYVADPDLCREIMIGRYKEFLKPVQFYGILDVY